uniref:Ig-like domain-containing protein n=1 Tax=Chrysemys picta bellii TaxID=8478 RepID=A0A8C3HG11_CHRPI
SSKEGIESASRSISLLTQHVQSQIHGSRRGCWHKAGEGLCRALCVILISVPEDVSKISAPKVAIFPPSKQEIKEKRKATLVCLVTGFYPDHIKLVWRVNGVERKEGVRTDESLMDKNEEKYSLTSRLRISRQEWSNPKNVFHCKVEFYGNGTEECDKFISGVADCSVSEESYLRSAMAGKSVYVLLIFKSALYGVFVMGLMLRNKQVQ